VAALVSKGIAGVDAGFLAAVVPIAFSWMILRKLGVEGFGDELFAFDSKERPVAFAMVREHYFAAALSIADDIATHGFSSRISRTTFEAIVARSRLMQVANDRLDAGEDVTKIKLPVPVVVRVSAEELTAARSGHLHR
jgi:hypothetical protein